MNENIYSIFTGRRVPKPDTALADWEADHFGRYVGSLPKYSAEVIRGHMEAMHIKREQIEALMAEFKVMWEGYYHHTVAAMSIMGVSMDEFDHKRHELYVDKNDHCWLVDAEERDKQGN